MHFIFYVFLFFHHVHAERLKDIADLAGSRKNALLGYGLVVGLANTGDNFYAGLGMQSVANMLRYLGVNVDPNQLRLQNVAAVMVTADIPAFIAPGQRLDVVVSSMGNARSLEGGTLVVTPLKGSDGKVYALAQGPLTVGGSYVGGITGSSLRRNLPTVGRISGGAAVEREIPLPSNSNAIQINLKLPDFTTAVRLASAVQKKMQERYGTDTQASSNSKDSNTKGKSANANQAVSTWAWAENSGMIKVQMPKQNNLHLAEMMAELESLEVDVDIPAKVVVNERTGTVVLGESVRLTAAAVAHGGVTLQVWEQPLVVQPEPFARGQTVVVPQTDIKIQEEKHRLHYLKKSASLEEAVNALNTLGVRPRDLIAILQALKSAGALHAEIVVH